MNDDSDSASRDSSQSDGQLNANFMSLKKKKTGRGSGEVKGHFQCGCSKYFTTYRSLYLHILHRHGGEFTKNTRIISNGLKTSIDRFVDTAGNSTSVITLREHRKPKSKPDGTVFSLFYQETEAFLKRLGILPQSTVAYLYTQSSPITVQYLVDNFPTSAFNSESDYLPLLKSMQKIQRHEDSMKEFSGFFLDRSQRAFMPDPLTLSEKPTCDLVMAYFVVCIASFLSLQQIRVVDEVIILANMFRKLLNAKADHDSPEDRLALFTGSGLPVDYTGNGGQSLIINSALLNHLLEDMTPSLMGNQIR